MQIDQGRPQDFLLWAQDESRGGFRGGRNRRTPPPPKPAADGVNTVPFRATKVSQRDGWHGLTENAGPENAGPQKQDRKMKDKLPKAIT